MFFKFGIQISENFAIKKPLRNMKWFQNRIGSDMNYYFFSLVFIPSKGYSGQKLIKLVRTNTPARTSNTIPNVPVITLVKYNIATSAASAIRIILSVVPMFGFIIRLV